jgi:RNA polymerase sigma factor (TIGR02999 family)
VGDAPDFETLIARWRAGNTAARDALIAGLHAELAHIASARLRREPNASLATGDLVNDAIVQLIRIDMPRIAGQAHFIALASHVMRNVLIDHARSKATGKRRHQKVELNTNIDGARRFDLIALDSALIRLGAVDAQLMELVEMRYFGGMSIGDCAEVLGLSEATVKRRWQVARAWLTAALVQQLDRD